MPEPEIFERFGHWAGDVEPGWTVNWLGVRTRAKIQGLEAARAIRHVETAPPPPSEDFFEWLDVLESVSESQGRYTIVELGAGWGRWLANAAAAVRRLDPARPFLLVGVEAEPTHFRWLRLHLRDNGIDPDDHVLHRAAVSADDGTVRFRRGNPAAWYGQAIERPDPAVRLAGPVSRVLRWAGNAARDRRAGERVSGVRSLSLDTILGPLEHVDLLDADIQGAESEVFEAARDVLAAKVDRVHVGTHGVENEEGLRALFKGLGWELRYDYPGGHVSETPWGPVPFEDGAQSWLNPARRVRA